MNRDEFKALIRQDEGLGLTAYYDCCGVTTRAACKCEKIGTLTVGHGHTGPDVHEGDVISLAHAERLLEDDCAKAVSLCRQGLAFFDALDDKRQCVLASMVFQMGLRGTLEFKRMLAAIESKDWVRAANEMKMSHWASQARSRCARLAEMLERGDTIH
jgi:lysozyme